MTKENPSSPTYILQLKLMTELFQELILEKRFEIARKLYNRYLGELQKRKKVMEHDSVFIHWKEQPYNSEKKKVLSDLRKKYGLNFHSIDAFATRCRQTYKKHIDSDTNSKLAKRAWGAVEELLFNPGTKKVRFKKHGTMDSLEGKKMSGIRYTNQTLEWNGLKIPVIVRKNDRYAHTAMIRDRIKFVRIIRQQIKGKTKFYIQLVMEGYPPQKYNAETGEVRNPVNEGKVGLDIGTQTLAISSEKEVKLLELAPSIDKIEKEKRNMLRKLDRSRRATNPNKYNEDGTIKKDNRAKWIRSKNYLKILAQYKEIQRKQTAKRKQDHEALSNYILSLGDEVKVETMNFKGLAKRAKETKISEKTGKFQRKKRYGKSIGNKAPSMLLRILKQKLAYVGKKLCEVNRWELKASQYNHIEDSCTKKTIHQRWDIIVGIRVQRDLYSAFLLQHTINKREYDKQALNENFASFLLLHEKEIERLKLVKPTISSMGF
ncbi:transposase [Bacillus sp. T33-2]|uniref:transposase n=1 Tax=Bacillus sp. T33-2 TaxID=2054168 RepID=UPI000C771AFE|nr:transposase [Bacillus sp. T33-2]PLR92572.1 transposase [Bacillus sp. T33-2]